MTQYSELSKYKFEEIVYLKKFLHLPSSSLYKSLKKLYKPQYEPFERIVLAYQGPIPYDLVAHLQRVVAHLDISNCFVLLCNDDPATPELLEQVRSKYSKDSTQIELLTLAVNDTHLEHTDYKPLLNPPENMCMYPWVQIEFKANGSVRPCCVFENPILDQQGNELDLADNKEFSVDKIYFSPTMQNLRQDFREGKFNTGCSKCWKEEHIGKRSDRMLYNWAMRDKIYDIDYESESLDNVVSLDLKLGNLCNLSCRICSARESSSIASEVLSNLPQGIDKKTHPAYTLLRKGRWPETQKFFWSEITKLLPNLVYCQFAGGEPLLLPHHFEMLQKAIDLGYSKKITLRYNTNATQCPEHVFDLWKEFALVHLDLSIDDIGSRFEYQRNGAKWQDVQQNVEKFNKVRSSKIKTQMSTAINILNVLYLPEICDWYDTQNFDSLWLNVVWGPSELCVANMTAEAKELVLKKLCNWDFKQHQWQVDPVIELLRNGQTVDNTAFVEKIKKLDRLRNQDLALAHQEIANAMGYVLQ